MDPKQPTLSSIELLQLEEAANWQYLSLVRAHLKNTYSNKSVSRPYTYELSLRKHLDAVSVLLFSKSAGEVFVHLRRTLRPAIALRQVRRQNGPLTPGPLPLADSPVLLEVVAGILEEGEREEAGIIQRAIAEVWEEAGYRVTSAALISLGAAIFPTPGLNPEKIFLYAADISGLPGELPPGDGSPIEEISGLEVFALSGALDACEAGDILDAKTEISLHRLLRHLKTK